MIPTSEPSMPPKLPPHVREVRNKTGRPYYYLQVGRGTDRAAKAIRLPDIHDPQFWLAYAEARGIPPPPNRQTVKKLVAEWQASPEWDQMSERTRKEWVRLSRMIVERWGELEVKGIAPHHVIRLRDQWAHQPATANNVLRVLGSVLSWSVPRAWRPDNPCVEIPKLKGGDGYLPWPWEVIEAAERELRETRPDLWWAVALALYTGQRLGDVLAMRWNAINSGGLLAVKQGKTGIGSADTAAPALARGAGDDPARGRDAPIFSAPPRGFVSTHTSTIH